MDRRKFVKAAVIASVEVTMLPEPTLRWVKMIRLENRIGEGTRAAYRSDGKWFSAYCGQATEECHRKYEAEINEWFRQCEHDGSDPKGNIGTIGEFNRYFAEKKRKFNLDEAEFWYGDTSKAGPCRGCQEHGGSEALIKKWKEHYPTA